MLKNFILGIVFLKCIPQIIYKGINKWCKVAYKSGIHYINLNNFINTWDVSIIIYDILKGRGEVIKDKHYNI